MSDAVLPTPTPSASVRPASVGSAPVRSAASLLAFSAAGVPLPLLFMAGAAFGVLVASLIVLCTHSTRTARSTDGMFGPAPMVAAPVVAKWQPNVIEIRPAAPDPMFDMPPVVEPASLNAPAPPRGASSIAAPARPFAKKAITRNAVRRHPAGKQAASGDLLTAAL